MKFQLFGRLRDDEQSQTNSSRDTGLSGGSLDRTVENMFQQGYSEEEIKQELQGQYSSSEITRAVNNVVKSSATDNEGPEPMTPYQTDQSNEAVSPMDEGFNNNAQQQSDNSMNPGNQGPDFGNNQQNQSMEGLGQGSQGFEQENRDNSRAGPPQDIQRQGKQGSMTENGTVDPAVEELIETVVAEKFGRISNEFSSVYDELDILIEELEELESRVHDLEVRDDEDQEQFVQKVDEMEEHIDSYQSRIGGLEKAFQQVLPSLVDNVKQLTSLVEEIKEEKGIETSTQISKDDVEDDIDMSDW